MDTDQPAAQHPARRPERLRSHLFVVRLWKTEADGGAEYRGTVRDVAGGVWGAFRDWSDAAAFMIARYEEDANAEEERKAGEQG